MRPRVRRVSVVFDFLRRDFHPLARLALLGVPAPAFVFGLTRIAVFQITTGQGRVIGPHPRFVEFLMNQGIFRRMVVFLSQYRGAIEQHCESDDRSHVITPLFDEVV